MNINGIRALTTLDEQAELNAVLPANARKIALIAQNKAFPVGLVKLKRTYTMMGYKYWRVVAPASHNSFGSDLSILGLKEWGIIS